MIFWSTTCVSCVARVNSVRLFLSLVLCVWCSIEMQCVSEYSYSIISVPCSCWSWHRAPSSIRSVPTDVCERARFSTPRSAPALCLATHFCSTPSSLCLFSSSLLPPFLCFLCTRPLLFSLLISIPPFWSLSSVCILLSRSWKQIKHTETEVKIILHSVKEDLVHKTNG